MRTLGEILEAAKSGQRPSPDECYWSLLALEALATFDSAAWVRLVEGHGSAMTAYEEQFALWKRALAADPQVWVGPNNDPANPAVQRRRKMALGLFAKAEAEIRRRKS